MVRVQLKLKLISANCELQNYSLLLLFIQCVVTDNKVCDFSSNHSLGNAVRKYLT